MILEVDGTIDLGIEALRHVRVKGEEACTCDRAAHPVTALVDLAAVLERESNPVTTDNPLTADVLPEPWEKAIQLLHEQAGHATAYAENCREPGCAELYGGAY